MDTELRNGRLFEWQTWLIDASLNLRVENYQSQFSLNQGFYSSLVILIRGKYFFDRKNIAVMGSKGPFFWIGSLNAFRELRTPVWRASFSTIQILSNQPFFQWGKVFHSVLFNATKKHLGWTSQLIPLNSTQNSRRTTLYLPVL